MNSLKLCTILLTNLAGLFGNAYPTDELRLPKASEFNSIQSSGFLGQTARWSLRHWVFLGGFYFCFIFSLSLSLSLLHFCESNDALMLPRFSLLFIPYLLKEEMPLF